VALSNPPFERKSSLTTVGADGREVREDREIERQDFVATTSNKQLDFVQHITTGRVGAVQVFPYDELIARDKANLDLTWLKDESLEDMDNLPSPDVIAREIVGDLTAALAEFEAVAAALEVQLPRRAEP